MTDREKAVWLMLGYLTFIGISAGVAFSSGDMNIVEISVFVGSFIAAQVFALMLIIHVRDTE